MKKKRKSSVKQTWISNKIEKILKEGVRKNTQRPISKSNPRVKVSSKRAQAIAYSMYRRKKR